PYRSPGPSTVTLPVPHLRRPLPSSRATDPRCTRGADEDVRAQLNPARPHSWPDVRALAPHQKYVSLGATVEGLTPAIGKGPGRKIRPESDRRRLQNPWLTRALSLVNRSHRAARAAGPEQQQQRQR